MPKDQSQRNEEQLNFVFVLTLPKSPVLFVIITHRTSLHCIINCLLIILDTVQKIKFSMKDFFSKCDEIRKKPADLVTFTEEILYRKLHFLCSGIYVNHS